MRQSSWYQRVSGLSCAGRYRYLSGWLAGWLAVWLSGCLTGWLSVCLAVWLSGCLTGCLTGWLAGWLSLCLPVCLHVCPSVCSPTCLPVCLSVCLSVCLPTSVYWFILCLWIISNMMWLMNVAIWNWWKWPSVVVYTLGEHLSITYSHIVLPLRTSQLP